MPRPSESSKLKLRAMATRAEGGEDSAYRAAVLFHAAARAERRALDLLAAPSAETRLRSAIEQCGCLIDGLDPAAIEAWGDVLEASEQVSASVAGAIRSRIDPAFHAFVKRYDDMQKTARDITAGLGGARALRPAERAKARRASARWLAIFPGDPVAWTTQSALESTDGDFESAWRSIERARELDPKNSQAMGMAFLLAPDALPKARVDEYLEANYALLQRGRDPSDVFLTFVVASLRAADAPARRRAHVDRALEALALGESRPPAMPEHPRFFRALRRIAGDMRDKRKPGVDALYRAGLGALVARAASEGEQDPVAILAREVGLMGGRLSRAA
jgi:hypothetical protein